MMNQEELARAISALAHAGVKLGAVVRGEVASVKIEMLDLGQKLPRHEQTSAMFEGLRRSTKVPEFVKSFKALMSEDAEGYRRLVQGQAKIVQIERKSSSSAVGAAA